MKSFVYIAVVTALLGGLAIPAHASGYLSGYGGGGSYFSGTYGSGSFSGGNKLSNYSNGGYSGGYGYSLVNFGYNSGSGNIDAPHRNSWQNYQNAYATWAAKTYATLPCGAYHRNPLGCKQSTTRWSAQ